MHFDHERLDVYKASLKFAVLSTGIVAALPKGNSHISDQLNRASLSIVLNVAEGAGEFAKGEKARFYRIAKRSATECAACLDVCSRLEIVEAGIADEGREILHKTVCMLVKLIRNLGDG